LFPKAEKHGGCQNVVSGRVSNLLIDGVTLVANESGMRRGNSDAESGGAARANF
jgi:hypothetical protein